mmetsp:Transcript_1535/g.1033  ORF Transcript_1535/g.1033 Transcript_1535/m.1033 type:complete len:90 (+) Transcript_1535:337-606(+)
MLINNAAIVRGKRVADYNIEQFAATMEINVTSQVLLCMEFLKQKEIKGSAHGRFHLVNVSSVAGHMTSEYFSDYCASKFALRGFITCLR